MKTYLVGGAVRDKLLGHTPKDKDFVITGATEEELLGLGFVRVGNDFPTFIKKDTPNVEYSLARAGRDIDGKAFFGREITLEEDLQKRDLTINSMAIDTETGELIDPYGGQKDLRDKILRHTSTQGFMEDPIRILRVARFAARYSDFVIDPATMHLMRYMSDSGKLENAVAERVWKELSRGLMENKPSRMLMTMVASRAMDALIPELRVLWGTPQVAEHHPEVDTGIHIELCLDYAAKCNFSLNVRYAALVHDLGKGITPKEELPKHHRHELTGLALIANVSDRLKVPKELKDTALAMCREHISFGQAMQLKASTVVRMLKRCDAFRRPERFEEILQASVCDFRGRGGSYPQQIFPQHDRFRYALRAAREVDCGEIALRYQESKEFIADAIHGARVSAVKRAERKWPDEQIGDRMIQTLVENNNSKERNYHGR